MNKTLNYGRSILKMFVHVQITSKKNKRYIDSIIYNVNIFQENRIYYDKKYLVSRIHRGFYEEVQCMEVIYIWIIWNI